MIANRSGSNKNVPDEYNALLCVENENTSLSPSSYFELQDTKKLHVLG